MLSWKWVPVWAVPLLVVWPALIAHAVLGAGSERPELLDLFARGLVTSIVAALPFFGLALISSARRTRPFVVRGAVLGGLVAAILIWWPRNDYIVDSIRGEVQGFEGIGVAYLVLASPLVVAVGMIVGVLIARYHRPAG